MRSKSWTCVLPVSPGNENQFILAEAAQEGEPCSERSLHFQKTDCVNSRFDNRVSHRLRALFLSGTPVPLTVRKALPYSRESDKIVVRGVVFLMSEYASFSEDGQRRLRDLNLDSLPDISGEQIPIEWEVRIADWAARLI